MIEIIPRRQFEQLNKQYLNYHLADAEKDYMLCIVMMLVSQSVLHNKLIFKGGTAIHHCYLPGLRFSEDVDFTAVDRNISLEEVKAVLESENLFEVKKEYVSGATIKIERLKYFGPLVQPNSLKFEIDFVQDVLLKPNELIYNNI